MPSLFFNNVSGLARNFIKKDTLSQVFSCKFCEIFKNTFFREHLQVTASAQYLHFFLLVVRKIFLPFLKYIPVMAKLKRQIF